MGALEYYLDASFLVALLTPEPFSDRAADFARANPATLIVSDLAAAEFASAIARRVRIKESPLAEAMRDLGDFDLWVARSAVRPAISPDDVALATGFLRRLDLPLRTPDAIHIAIAQRIGASLVTFDRRMAANARALDVPVADA